MGEKVEGAKDGEKKAADAGQKKDDGAVTAVFKIDMHCEGCAKKIRRVVKHLNGVSDVKADSASNKLTVTGKVDPAVIKESLEQKTKKKVDLVSPQPKKDGGGDKKADEKAEKKTDEKTEKKPEEKSEKKPDEKAEKKPDAKAEKKPDEKAKKPEEKKADDKKPKETTVVLKIRLHCEGCIQKIRKAIIKYKGVDAVTIDSSKDLVTVKGAIEGKDLAGSLKNKFKRSVEIVPPKKEEPEKNKPEAAKLAPSGGDGGGAKMEVSRMEYHGYAYPPSTFYYGGPAYSHGYAMEAQPSNPMHGFANSSGYVNQNYVHEGNAMPMYGYEHSHAPQMFSDENPNACSVM
ncbi:heavy metal-associated isoprenylated plant protein 3-like [Momordica charantia]|uniref:Heavy metal-associated isoprenylated plant protein 3-like n=1 Tax=Momordica charantia TaxID=3673 RepID=A0A6J1CRC6_MOMCH|nr:heavy metal-associated isoprenylated plant protein 3-like [Momordica charantia]